MRLAEGRRGRDRAERVLAEILIANTAGLHVRPETITVVDVIRAHMASMATRLSRQAFVIRRDYLIEFADHTGDKMVIDCIPLDLTQWIDANAHRWRSDWTKFSASSSVQTAFRWAARNGMITRNPFAGVSHPKGAPRRPITDDEFRSIMISSAPGSIQSRRRPTPFGRWKQVLWFLRWTGARPSEVAAMEWQHVDMDSGRIVLDKHKTAKSRQDRSPRIIVMPAVAVRLLRAIRQLDPNEQHVFRNAYRKPWTKNAFVLRFRRARIKAGISSDAKLYGTRHQFGTRLIVSGSDIKTAAELMGHTTTRMTEHYLHLATQQAHLVDAAERQARLAADALAVKPKRDAAKPRRPR